MRYSRLGDVPTANVDQSSVTPQVAVVDGGIPTVKLRLSYIGISLFVALCFGAVHYLKDARNWGQTSNAVATLDGLETAYLDHKFRQRGKVEVNPSVVIAAVDEKAIRDLGVWGSWERSVYAQMSKNLVHAGASVVDTIWCGPMRASLRPVPLPTEW